MSKARTMSNLLTSSGDVITTALDNVGAAGALMDSELTAIASVKALNQGVATGDSPTFAALTSTGEITANSGTVTATNTTGPQFQAKYSADQWVMLQQSGGASYIKSRSNTNDGEIYLQGGHTAKVRMVVRTNGDIDFYNTDGTTKKMEWDATANALEFDDNAKAIFGAGSDLQIYHDGSQSIIHDNGTGPLRIRTPQFRVHNGAQTETLIVADEDAGVSLYYDNAAKLATTATGVDVTGTVNATTVDLGNWTVTESGGVLFFATGGINKMKLDASGNLTCVGNVTAYGSV